MSNTQLAHQGELRAGLGSSSSGDGGEEFTVAPDGATSPSQAERGCAQGPGGAWFYSCSCHMLQVKVIMLG